MQMSYVPKFLLQEKYAGIVYCCQTYKYMCSTLWLFYIFRLKFEWHILLTLNLYFRNHTPIMGYLKKFTCRFNEKPLSCHLPNKFLTNSTSRGSSISMQLRWGQSFTCWRFQCRSGSWEGPLYSNDDIYVRCCQWNGKWGLQRVVVYLGWPIAPSNMSPNAGERGELRCLNQWVQLYTRAQINFEDLTPYLTNERKSPTI
jgi:hypothetical protein